MNRRDLLTVLASAGVSSAALALDPYSGIDGSYISLEELKISGDEMVTETPEKFNKVIGILEELLNKP